MSQHKLTVEGAEYSYAEYLTKVFDYVQLKGFNKEAFQHVSALLWDLDKRVTVQAATIEVLMNEKHQRDAAKVSGVPMADIPSIGQPEQKAKKKPEAAAE